MGGEGAAEVADVGLEDLHCVGLFKIGWGRDRLHGEVGQRYK